MTALPLPVAGQVLSAPLTNGLPLASLAFVSAVDEMTSLFLYPPVM